MRKYISILLLIISTNIAAQKLSLQTCIDSAVVNYPISKQAEIYQQIMQSDLNKIQNSNLPQVDLNGKATYQSEAISLPIHIPGLLVPEINKDQYKVQLEINQAIYKGGLTKAQKELSKSNNAISNTQIDIQLGEVKRSLIATYYQILLNKDLINISTTFQKTLEVKQQEMQAQIDAGVLLKSAADLIKVEQLTIEQKILELEINQKTLASQLQKITGINISTETQFEIPKYELNNDGAQQRPEYKLLILSQQKIDVLKSFSTAQSMPKAFAFTTLGYGRPGFNYLSNEFAPYALVGVGFSWTLWNWGNFKEEKKLLDFNKNVIETQKENFLLNLSMNLLQLHGEIETQEMLLKQAEEIVKLRKNIAETTDNLMKNGVVNASQYIDDLQKFEKSKLDAQVYKIKLSIAQTNYLWTLGKL